MGHNYARIDHVQTPTECQRLCVEDSRCRSIDYVRPFQECAVSYDTKDENPRSFVDEEGVDYYEWFCWDGKGNPDTIPGGSSSGEGGPTGGSTSGRSWTPVIIRDCFYNFFLLPTLNWSW